MQKTFFFIELTLHINLIKLTYYMIQDSVPTKNGNLFISVAMPVSTTARRTEYTTTSPQIYKWNSIVETLSEQLIQGSISMNWQVPGSLHMGKTQFNWIAINQILLVFKAQIFRSSPKI